jgi:3-hydroxyacyl-CoA dehydrogenase
LVSLVKAGRLGRKTGAGFFDYQPGPQEAAPQAAAALRQVTPTVTRLIAQWAVPAGVHTPEATVQRLLLPMVLEATRILEEGKVDGPGDIDLAVLFGLGFPRSRGGLLWWADRLGAGRILEMLTALQRLGPRAQPTGLLRDLAAGGERFYGRRQLSRDGTS